MQISYFFQVLGNLVEITSKEKTHKAPLQIEHHRFVLFISISAVIVATVSFVLGLILTNASHFLSTFVNGFLIVLVAWVPQGLPVTLTAQLLIVARRLAKYGMYLKKLECADTLGITSILMVDKTGVLTQDDLRVTDLWTFENSTSAKDIIELHQKSLGSSNPENLKPKYQISDNNCNLISGIDDIYGILITVMSICDKAIIENSHHSAKINLPRKTPSFRRKNLLSLNPEDLTKAKKAQKQVQFSLKHKDLKEKSIIGKSLDVALVKFVENVTSVDKIRDDYEIVFEVPFSSQRRFHLVIVCSKSSKKSSSSSSYSDEMIKYTVMVKGAPEELILNCNTIVTENGEEKLDDDKLLGFEKAFLQFCNQGKSCLGFAMKEFEDFTDTIFYMDPTGGSNFPDDSWCFLGMTALYDPPIPGIAEAVKAADKADIRLFMISGDHPVTSEALARQMQFDFGDSNIAAADASIASIASGIVGEGVDVEKVSSRKSSMSSTSFSTNSIRIDPIANLECIRGEMVKELSQADWARLLSRKRVVFARTTPLQKMKIVKSCQQTNAIVAVTGDGVMAAPALKQADVGLAMEAVGSIFAKEAADIVITQPQLPNLIAAISQARLLFDNLKKTIAYSLSHLMPEVIPVWLTFILGFPIGLNSIQILTMDLISEIPPSIALVFEPAERDLMKRSPRKKRSLLVTKALLAYSYCFAGMIISIGCILAYFTVFWSYEVSASDLFDSDTKYWSLNSPNFTLSSGKLLTAEEQTKIYEEASAAWHITLVMSQAFHLWMCTTRRISLFKHGFRNWTLFAAVFFEIATLFFFIFVPGVNNFLQVSPPAWYIWIYPFIVGVILLLFNEIRKYYIRKYPKNSFVRIFKW
uniref:Cation-transporting P-type ATPase C-terminal domain-containing protein n=1 Tax=Panagrolaimus sp. PS1159 TaxID=55785 RepID=A0AC35FTA5_9BILA